MEFLQLFVLKKLNLVPGKVEKLRKQTKTCFYFFTSGNIGDKNQGYLSSDYRGLTSKEEVPERKNDSYKKTSNLKKFSEFFLSNQTRFTDVIEIKMNWNVFLFALIIVNITVDNISVVRSYNPTSYDYPPPTDQRRHPNFGYSIYDFLFGPWPRRPPGYEGSRPGYNRPKPDFANDKVPDYDLYLQG